ncbi:MAG: RHS repeat domain-containing protein [Rhodocyclaceae bacterium]
MLIDKADSTKQYLYRYDGFGRRISKISQPDGATVRYVYDSAHHLIGEYQADGSPIKEYLWLGDHPWR